MTVLSTTGAASLKRSGFMTSGNVLYNYYHIDLVGQIYGSSTMGGTKKLLKYDNAGNATQRINFIFAKDLLIAGPYFGSYTGGKSWYGWAMPAIYSTDTIRGGLNGVGAFRSIDGTAAMGYVNWLGDEEANIGVSIIRADGTVTNFNTLQSTGYYVFGGFVYSPALDAFFWYAQDQANTIRVYDGASPGTQIGTGSNISSFSVYGMSVSSDGYPLVVNQSGFPAVYTLRKITSTGLAYTNLGTVTDNQPTQSTTFVWDESRSRYCKASYVGTLGSGTLYFGYSSDGLTWTNSTIGTISSGVTNLSVTGLTLFLDGSDIYVQGKMFSNEGPSTFQRVSTNGGSSWAEGGASTYALSTRRIVT